MVGVGHADRAIGPHQILDFAIVERRLGQEAREVGEGTVGVVPVELPVRVLAGLHLLVPAVLASERLAEEHAAICERVQQNLDAGVYRRGVLSAAHEGAVAWFQARVAQAVAE